MKFKTEAEVAEWVDSVDEHNTQQADIQEELEAAWPVVFGHPLSDEDRDVQMSSWSHLCSAVM